MRLFFALQPDATTALEIAHWRDRQLHCDGRAVNPANFHVTLAFIGELDHAGLDRLCRSVDEGIAEFAPRPGRLDLDRTGYWPKPGIYWLGPDAWCDDLTRLAKKLASLGAAVGARIERRRFVPHITLFRRCQSPPQAPARIPSLQMSYAHFTLCESRQGRAGVVYQDVAGWELADAG